MRRYLALGFWGLTLVFSAFFAHAEMEDSQIHKIPVEDLAREMTLRYQALKPSQWREHGSGIVSVLPEQPYYDLTPAEEVNAWPTSGRGQLSQRGVALTLDACDAKTDLRIIALLRELRLPAAIFVTNRWLQSNAALAAELADDPQFSLEAHGVQHRPASVTARAAYGIRGTSSIAALVDEVENNARAIAAATGKRPRWYRSGTAFYDDVALLVIQDLGFSVAGYSISADQGASLPAKTVAQRMLMAKDGDILLIHVNRPQSGVFEGLKEALPKMIEAGVNFVGL